MIRVFLLAFELFFLRTIFWAASFSAVMCDEPAWPVSMIIRLKPFRVSSDRISLVTR